MVESLETKPKQDSLQKYLHTLSDSVFEKGGILIKLYISAVAHQPYSENDSFTDDPVGRIYCVPKYDTENLSVSTFKWVHGGEFFDKKGEEPDGKFHFRPLSTEKANNTTNIKF